MTKRTLSLKRETLAELSDADLSRVAGAVQDASGISCPVRDCLDDTYQICIANTYLNCIPTNYCPTLFC